MKTCPICSRTYGDDTLTFCLDDGARLSAPYDPHETLKEPAARYTDPPTTEILPSELTPVNSAPAPMRSTIAAFAPLGYPEGAPQSQLTEKRSGTHWIILSGALALVVFGLVMVLGYIAWKANSKSIPEPSSVSTAPTYSNFPANANRDIESKLHDDRSLQWLDGVWEGRGYQSNTKTTWAVRLTAQDSTYAIDYPDIPCRGKWTLMEKNTDEAKFSEVITQGIDLCANNSKVIIRKTNDSQISCTYTYARSRVVIATAVLTKKAQPTPQK
jgi:hypothetical protein